MTLRVHLLGGAGAELGSARIAFLPDKRFQFLAFLAYAGDWVSREKLSYLFWPDTSTEQARHNLRQLLRRVQALGWVRGLEAERQRIRWLVPTDLNAFRAALEAGKEREALEHYRGPLLEGLESDDGSEFGAWLAFEREHLQARWRRVVLDRAADLERTGQHAQAADWLFELLERDPLDEAVLQGYLRVSSLAGRQLAALKAYQAFAERLERELGLEPTTTTQQLAQAIREAAPNPETVTSATAASGGLPRAATAFVGRALELGELERVLSAKDCRLLSILGLGGIGKTRLALQAAQALSGDCGGRVHFVALETLPSADLLPVSIAESLGLSLQGKDPPLAQVARYLGPEPTLLVLDNFESVLDGAALVSDLLEACPGLKVIVTSREHLRLVEEWLFPIDGLLYAKNSQLSLEDASALDAVQLFLGRARQVQPGFALGRETLPHILRICQLVGGSPLGLELAATWVRAFPVAEIARELEHSLDFLASSSRNRPERHHSLRATFEYSWGLLSAREQAAARRLSIFVGGFTREAAAVVADVPVTVLAALLDKSLLRVSAQGRYDAHPLVSQFLQEKLAERPAEQAEMKDKHGAYFQRVLEHQWQTLLGQQGSEGVAAIAEDFENIRLTWQLVLENGQVQDVLRTIPALTFFFDARVRYLEGIDLFEQASRSFGRDHPEHRRVRGNLRAAQAWLSLWLGRFEQALDLIPEASELLAPSGSDWGAWLLLRTRGFLAFFTGDFGEAARCWRDELAGLREESRLPVEAELLSRLALVYACLGEGATASSYLAEALSPRPKLGSHPRLTCLLYAGFAELTLGRAQAARTLLGESEALARALGDVRYSPHHAYGLGASALELGQVDEARSLCQRALELARANDDLLAKCWAQMFLGRVHLALGEPERARACLLPGVREAQARGFAPTVRYGLAAAAELRAAEGQADEAAAWLRAVLAHPADDHFAKAYARRLLGELGAEQGEGRARPLEEVLSEALSL